MAQSTGFSAKKAYLILYNAVSAVAWATVLGRVAVVIWLKGAPFVPLVVDNFARITQTCAIMEVLHAFTGAYFLPQPDVPGKGPPGAER
jgi:very-long-chain (3R)-3-hydroxyacyl-CoA dehydratase